MNQINIPAIPDLLAVIDNFEKTHHPIPGLQSAVRKDAFVRQLIDSIRDIEVCGIISRTSYHESFTDPQQMNFNPLKGAKYYFDAGNLDEAIWLVFLAIYFGKARPGKWNFLKAFYGGINSNFVWDWRTITTKKTEFDNWIGQEINVIKRQGKFGNHRKRESLNNIVKSIETYFNWVGPSLSHQDLLDHAIRKKGKNPHDLFAFFYDTLSSVYRFGRMAKIDFLCMLGKLGIVLIEPGRPFINESTGPLAGARLIFGIHDKNDLESVSTDFANELGCPFSMQIVEDAICNWQKSPTSYIRFTG